MTADDLKRFCADAEDIRYALHKPWTRDGWTYATNGHILVRVPAIDGVPENELAPNAETVWNSNDAPGEFIPVPECKAPAKGECDICHGAGLHDCSCGNEHDCCNCDGSGEVEVLKFTKVGNAWFSDKYLALIQGWGISPNNNKSAWIRNGDVMGLLMPCREPGTREFAK